MKKAKILIPSISLLCFSAIACVTGSVAWFSSVSSANVNTSNFAVKALDGSMDVEVYHGVGTKATLASATDKQKIKDGSGNIIGYKGSDSISVGPDTYGEGSINQLTHGSYDAGAKKAYSLKPFSSTDNPEYEEIGAGKTQDKANESNFWASGTEGCYHIFTFDLKFNYDFGGATVGKYNLFFDVDSTCGRATPVTSGLDTAKGFRMAFINTDTNDWVVWSKLQGATWGTEPKVNSKYVGIPDKATDISTIEYKPAADGNLIYDGDSSVTKITTSTGSAARKDCLGTFDASGTPVTAINIRVVCWYEGEDPNVVKSATMNAVNCSLGFYLKGYAA